MQGLLRDEFSSYFTSTSCASRLRRSEKSEAEARAKQHAFKYHSNIIQISFKYHSNIIQISFKYHSIILKLSLSNVEYISQQIQKIVGCDMHGTSNGVYLVAGGCDISKFCVHHQPCIVAAEGSTYFHFVHILRDSKRCSSYCIDDKIYQHQYHKNNTYPSLGTWSLATHGNHTFTKLIYQRKRFILFASLGLRAFAEIFALSFAPQTLPCCSLSG